LRLARGARPAYSSKSRRQDFTPHPLGAVLALQTVLQTDDRGLAPFLADSAASRDDLGLKGVPHSWTLGSAEPRLLKPGSSFSSSPASPRPPPTAA
jgi:hypothetical protein